MNGYTYLDSFGFFLESTIHIGSLYI